MQRHARGTFEVKLSPEPPYETVEGVTLGRVSIDKRFHGDLDATSSVQMLSAIAPVKGSAGYVALERVTGSLGGRSGTFVLQHLGTMDRGEPALLVRIVPDSASGELVGLRGEMTIQIAGGEHRYELTYSLD